MKNLKYFKRVVLNTLILLTLLGSLNAQEQKEVLGDDKQENTDKKFEIPLFVLYNDYGDVGIKVKDSDKNYVVFNVEGNNSEELYLNTLKYCELYKLDVTSSLENKHVKFRVHSIPIPGLKLPFGYNVSTYYSYFAGIYFKDGKVKYQILYPEFEIKGEIYFKLYWDSPLNQKNSTTALSKTKGREKLIPLTENLINSNVFDLQQWLINPEENIDNNW